MTRSNAHCLTLPWFASLLVIPVVALTACSASDGSRLSDVGEPEPSGFATAPSAPPSEPDEVVTAGPGARDEDTLLPPNDVPQSLAASSTGMAQVLYLNFEGAVIRHGAYATDNAQTNTSFIPPTDALVPAFDHTPWGPDRGKIIGQIVGGLRRDFAGYNVTVTTKRPLSGAYTMAMVGGTREGIGQGGNRIGVAPLDAGNSNPSDVIFAMTASLAPWGYDIRHISWLIAHEFGHSIGLRHTAPADAIMNATECHCAERWVDGQTTDGSFVFQEERKIIGQIFPVRFASGTSAGVVLDAFGGLHPFGGIALNAAKAPYWPNWDIARSISVIADRSGGWTLDGFGGVHAWGDAPAIPSPGYWPNWDIARAIVVLADKKSGYVMDGFGGLHKFGPKAPTLTGPYWKGSDVARGLEIHTNASGVADGGWILDSWGALHAFGAAPRAGTPSYFPNSNQWLAVHQQPGGGMIAAGRYGDVELLNTKAIPMRAGAAEWELWDITRDVLPLAQ